MASIPHNGTDSAGGVALVTPSDTVDLTNATRAIRVETSGDVKLTTVLGQSVVCAFEAGETRAIKATRIWSTGTTCTGIEAMW